ncbi:TrfB-related DNA-binding protein [Ralstonia mannitolilytica]|uniref:TrfB-related DNA-binding protein n=1 Tax=Ralstonia mannitolilytica TaxID=105219 RepID=UPI003B83DC6E
MSKIFKTVSAACGHVSRAAFVKAARRLGLSSESYRIADEVFLKGYRQATVARHVGVSRQRVHSVCRELLEEINNQLSPERATDEKTSSDSDYHGHLGRMCFATTSQHEK